MFQVILLIIFYLLQTVPTSTIFLNYLPNMILLDIFCFSVFDLSLKSSLLAIFAGFLLDTVNGSFFGVNGLILFICCTVVGVLFKYLIDINFCNVVFVWPFFSFLTKSMQLLSVYGFNFYKFIFFSFFMLKCLIEIVFLLFFYYCFKKYLNKN